jgi:Cu(I)/Ag(I) efflux system membrane fusion protein
MKNVLVLIVTSMVLYTGILTSCSNKSDAKEAGVYYTCPMHPDIKKDAPGQCPICGMDLVKKETNPVHKH